MDRQATVEQVKCIIGDFLKNRNIDLVDTIYRYEGRELFLRILVDKPEGGISLDDCAFINESLSMILDEMDLIQEKYILEVSSPGIDRPLNTRADFLRCRNRKVKFFLSEKINDKIELDGVIEEVNQDSVFIKIGDQTVEIALVKIKKAKQIIE